MDGPSDLTQLLADAGRGDGDASRRLMELVCGELRAIAGSYARGGRAGHTLQPTALVHETFVKLAGAKEQAFHDRAHFFAVAATAMRQVLADHARARKAQKRGGAWQRVTLDGGEPGREQHDLDLVALDEALDELCECDPRKHRVVELRFSFALPPGAWSDPAHYSPPPADLREPALLIELLDPPPLSAPNLAAARMLDAIAGLGRNE